MIIIQGIKRFYRLIIAISKNRLINYFSKYEKNSKNVIWIMGLNLRYFFTTSVLWDIATISALIKSGKTYSITINKNIRKVKNKDIYFTLHSNYNVFGFDNYVSVFDYLLKELINNDNKLIPSLEQAKFWENKAFMHRKFDELKIPTPRTLILTKKQIENTKQEIPIPYPFIVKLIHSYESKGIFKISNDIEFSSFMESMTNRNEEFLIQEILNMRKDIRIIFVDNKVEHFYWRINNSSDWRPTATSKGNSVDFESFPIEHKSLIEDYSRRLELKIGAFDIAWQNDDITSTPIVLEVSPVFSPNPKTNNRRELENYGAFKKKLKLFGYDYLYVNEIFRLKELHLSSLFRD